jgi:succinate dehydrogenase/fumarate reductase flavoprotein subunit
LNFTEKTQQALIKAQLFFGIKQKMQFLNKEIAIEKHIFDALIIGSGAAGYNCAVHLYDKSVKNIAILTEDRLAGTSRNTGSDKQTYYKIACAGEQNDSPLNMAQTLFSGGSMDGDIALCEAAHSLEEFFHLVSISVDFPHNKYGEFAGYKTDHDPLQRASSIGPYTSKKMTQQLEIEAQRRNINIIDKTRIIKLLADKSANRVFGVLCLSERKNFIVYYAKNIVFAVGGPCGLYRNTVYPLSHFGSSAIMAREGVKFSNITEWQYGIASIKFRWNLSGSYQQVIPRYISVDENGKEEEFLNKYFSSIEALSNAVFLKGYQWPFDPSKINNEGSSTVDMAIYIEKRVKGRKVYMDFMKNPSGDERIGQFSLENIGNTSHNYLSNSKALGKTPIERLEQLNPIAYELYKNNSIDLKKEYLEVDIVPQHNNGGAQVNIWWETSMKHLFAAGECAGTHGIKRPGGSALNSGQVGGLRAASFIADNLAKNDDKYLDAISLMKQTENQIKRFEKDFNNIVISDISTVLPLLHKLQDINSRLGAFLRPAKSVDKAIDAINAIANEKINAKESDIYDIFRLKEMILLSRILHETIHYYIRNGGKSRGSYLIFDCIDDFDFNKQIEIDSHFNDKILISQYDNENDKILTSSRPVRPIAQSDTWFERVWTDFRNGDIFKD